MAITFEINTKMLKRLEDIPLEIRLGPLDRCMKAFAKPIEERLKSLAPSSRKSGSRIRWSKKLSKDPKFASIDSGPHTGSKLLRNGGLVIGFKFEKGNKQQFINPVKRGMGREHNFWGAPGQVIFTISRKGMAYSYVRKKDSIGLVFHRSDRAVVKSFQQTKDAARTQFILQAQREVKGLNLG
jgi:hypothetical protein